MRINRSRVLLGTVLALSSLAVLLALNRLCDPRPSPTPLDEYVVDRVRPPYPASHGALQSYGQKASFRGNLKPDLHYMISFPVWG